MSFFNLRRGGAPSNAQKPTASSAQPESVEVVRKRAKHRLIGAAVLVLIGVVGFPLLFDTQPRPVAVDLAIEIPSRSAAKPLATPAKPASAGKTGESLAPSATLADKEELVADKPGAAPAPDPQPTAAEPAPKLDSGRPAVATVIPPNPGAPPSAPLAPVAPKPEPDTKAADASRAKALLEGKSAPTAPQADMRLVVQVGAFADADKARDTRQRLERAGLKTYAQVADTKDGKRTRVRVGPFATRADAEKAAAKIKSLDLPATILTL
jgi:DedD protein